MFFLQETRNLLIQGYALLKAEVGVLLFLRCSYKYIQSPRMNTVLIFLVLCSCSQKLMHSNPIVICTGVALWLE